jgi:hypothetical protein
MVAKNIVPDADTFIALFKATSLIGDVKTAYNGLMHLKQINIPVSIYMYNGLLRTYAGACAVPMISEETRNNYIEDAWNLFRQLQTSGLPVNGVILNSLLLVHTKAYDTAKVDVIFLKTCSNLGFGPSII